MLSALSSCETDETLIRWNSCEKVVLRLPQGVEFDNAQEMRNSNIFSSYLGLESMCRCLSDTRRGWISIDMRTIISVVPPL